MPATDIAKTVTTVFPWITTVVGWIVALLQWRKKRTAEAEIKLIRRRGDAPYFTPSSTTRSTPPHHRRIRRRGTHCRHGDRPHGLERRSAQGPAPADTPVRLVVENQGQPSRHVSVSLDGKAIQLRSEPALKFASGTPISPRIPIRPKKTWPRSNFNHQLRDRLWRAGPPHLFPQARHQASGAHGPQLNQRLYVTGFYHSISRIRYRRYSAKAPSQKGPLFSRNSRQPTAEVL